MSSVVKFLILSSFECDEDVSLINITLFDHIVVTIEVGIASQWRQQDAQFKNHHYCLMSGRAFELVDVVKDFN